MHGSVSLGRVLCYNLCFGERAYQRANSTIPIPTQLSEAETRKWDNITRCWPSQVAHQIPLRTVHSPQGGWEGRVGSQKMQAAADCPPLMLLHRDAAAAAAECEWFTAYGSIATEYCCARPTLRRWKRLQPSNHLSSHPISTPRSETTCLNPTGFRTNHI